MVAFFKWLRGYAWLMERSGSVFLERTKVQALHERVMVWVIARQKKRLLIKGSQPHSWIQSP